MANGINVDDTDFRQINEATLWVRNLLTEHGGIYLTEINGTMNIWFMNPKILLTLPEDLAGVIADTIDRLTACLIPEAAVAEHLSRRFSGRRTSLPNIRQMQAAVHKQLAQEVDLSAVYDQLEAALVHALYDFAESR